MQGLASAGASGSAVASADAAARLTRWRAVRRVLAVRLDNLGDVLMTTPALAAIRESVPEAAITLLTSPAAAGAAPHLAMIDALWTHRAAWVGQPAAGGGTGPSDRSDRADDEAALVTRIAAGGFDAAIVFTVCTQSALPAALVLRMAGVPLVLMHSRENPYGLASDWVPESDHVGCHSGARGVPGGPAAQPQALARHEVERQLALVAHVGYAVADTRLRFAVRAADRVRVAGRLAARGLSPLAPYAVMSPGASAASRRWPAAQFAVAARALAGHGLPVVFTGSEAEHALAAPALEASATAAAGSAAHAPVLSLVGELTLGELAALIEGARLAVSCNSAPVHLAAALGTPVVDLYALTNPQHGPWQVNARVLSHDVPCRWCLRSVCPEGHHACLARVTPDEVVGAAFELMRERRIVPIRMPPSPAAAAPAGPEVLA